MMVLQGDFNAQLQALVDAIGAEAIVSHILHESSEAVEVGMKLSHDSDGNLTADDISFLRGL